MAALFRLFDRFDLFRAPDMFDSALTPQVELFDSAWDQLLDANGDELTVMS